MCSIIGSFNKSTLTELYKLNSYRGELSYSVCTFRKQKDDLQIGFLMQAPGKMDDRFIPTYPYQPDDYFICHSQAPTTDSTNIHPANVDGALLWHNGIIKQKELEEGTWDTQWLLKNILTKGWGFLSDVDGTFACVMYDGKSLYAFRNEISPLFIDEQFNISSTRFEGSSSLVPNTIWKLDFKTRYLEFVGSFTTKENPYFIPEAE